MRRQRTGLGIAAAVWLSLVLGGAATAEVTTDHSGSLLVFPKVIANGTRDTLIQISNTSNSLVRAHCFYVNGAPANPALPPGPDNPPLWQEIDFDIMLTKQQPTHWRVSQGRGVSPLDVACSQQGVCLAGSDAGDACASDGDCADGYCSNTRCDNAGFDPGLIPPVVPDFTGELKCIEVDGSGAPLSGNHLKGEATLVTVTGQAFWLASEENVTLGIGEGFIGRRVFVHGDISKYNALAIIGNNNNGDGTLVLGGGQCVGAGSVTGAVCRTDADCEDAAPCAPEYNACPQTWILNHLAAGAPDLVLEEDEIGTGSSAVDTRLTVVPCSQDFELQEPSRVTLQFDTTDEFESRFSVSTTVDCWGSFSIGDVGASPLTFAGTIIPDPQGTMYLQTRIRSAAGTPGGVLMVAEEFHRAKTSTVESAQGRRIKFAAAAAVNVHVEGEQQNPDIITLPAEQLGL